MSVLELDMSKAACKDVDPDMFFPEPGGKYHGHTEPAKAVCGGCDIRLECLRVAIANDYDGIWGGTTVLERKSLKRKPRRRMSESTMEALQRSHATQNLRAAQRSVEQVTKVLETLGDQVPAPLRKLAELRLAYPTYTLGQVAEVAGVTKDSYAGSIRRLLNLTK